MMGAIPVLPQQGPTEDDLFFWRRQALQNMAALTAERDRRKADKLRYRRAINTLLHWAKEQGREQEAIQLLKEA